MMTRQEMESEVSRLLLEQRRLARLNLQLPPNDLMLLKRLLYRLGLFTSFESFNGLTRMSRNKEIADRINREALSRMLNRAVVARLARRGLTPNDPGVIRYTEEQHVPPTDSTAPTSNPSDPPTPATPEQGHNGDSPAAEDWDGSIDEDEVRADSEPYREDAATFDRWTRSGEHMPQRVHLESGLYHPPGRESPISVFRWYHEDHDGDRADEGEWTADDVEAYSQAGQYATDNNEDPPDPEDDDIPNDLNGVRWNRREHIASFTSGGDEQDVRLDEGVFEFGGQQHEAYRWTTYQGSDGDWTLDREQAIADGEEYATDNHEEPEPEPEPEPDNIHPYRYRPDYEPLGEKGPYYGAELETQLKASSPLSLEEAAQQTLDTLNSGYGDEEFAYLKEDSSIEGGSPHTGKGTFEIVTQPATLQVHKEQWTPFFANPPKGLISHDANAGLHIHVGRKGLSTLGIGKMVYFINHPANKELLTKLARRESPRWAAMDPTKKPKDVRSRGSRYVALNLLPTHTIEFRLFRGTFKPESFFAALEFVDALVNLSKPGMAGIEDMADPKTLIRYVATFHKEYPNLLNFLEGFTGERLVSRGPRKMARFQMRRSPVAMSVSIKFGGQPRRMSRSTRPLPLKKIVGVLQTPPAVKRYGTEPTPNDRVAEDFRMYSQAIRPRLHPSKYNTPEEHALFHKFITQRGLKLKKSPVSYYDSGTHTLYHPEPDNPSSVAKEYLRWADRPTKLRRKLPRKYANRPGPVRGLLTPEQLSIAKSAMRKGGRVGWGVLGDALQEAGHLYPGMVLSKVGTGHPNATDKMYTTSITVPEGGFEYSNHLDSMTGYPKGGRAVSHILTINVPGVGSKTFRYRHPVSEKFSRVLPKKYAKVDGHEPAHPLVSGFPIEFALRHLANDPNNHNDIRDIAHIALTGKNRKTREVAPNGHTEALWALHDALREHSHPMADTYNWMSAADKIQTDAHTHTALTELSNHIKKQHNVPAHVQQWAYTPEAQAQHVSQALGSQKHLDSTVKQRNKAWLEWVRQRVKQLKPDIEDKQVDESLRRHSYRAGIVWRRDHGIGNEHDEDKSLLTSPTNPEGMADEYAKNEKATRYARLTLGKSRPFRGPMGEQMTEHDYHDESGNKLGVVRVHPRNDGQTLHVHWVGPTDVGGGEVKNTIGSEGLYSLKRELKKVYPGAEFVTGFASSGTQRGKRVMKPMQRRGLPVKRYTLDIGATIKSGMEASRTRPLPNGRESQDHTAGKVLADALDEAGLPNSVFYRNLAHEGGLMGVVSDHGEYGHVMEHPPTALTRVVPLGNERFRLRALRPKNPASPQAVMVTRYVPGGIATATHHAVLTAPQLREWADHPATHHDLKEVLHETANALEPVRMQRPRRYAVSRRGDFIDSLRLIKSSNQKAMHQVAEQVSKQLGLEPTKVYDALHDTPHGAVPGVAQAVYGQVSPEVLHAAAAWIGLTSNAPGVAVFHPRPTGPDTLYRFRGDGSGMDLRVKLDRFGLRNRILIPHRKGFDVLIPDVGNKQREMVERYAAHHKIDLEASPGHFKPIGSADQAQTRSIFRDKVATQERMQRRTYQVRRFGVTPKSKLNKIRLAYINNLPAERLMHYVIGHLQRRGPMAHRDLVHLTRLSAPNMQKAIQLGVSRGHVKVIPYSGQHRPGNYYRLTESGKKFEPLKVGKPVNAGVE